MPVPHLYDSVPLPPHPHPRTTRQDGRKGVGTLIFCLAASASFRFLKFTRYFLGMRMLQETLSNALR